MHSPHFLDARTGSTEHPSLVSDPLAEFIYKKMERRWALKFAEGFVKIGSLFYYRTIKDDSGLIVDPHEGLEECEVTKDLVSGSPTLRLLSRGWARGYAARTTDGWYFVLRSQRTSVRKLCLPSTTPGSRSKQDPPLR